MAETDRDRRQSGTEDIRYIPRDLKLDASLDSEMEKRAERCAAQGHEWDDPVTRTFCRYCAGYWYPDPPAGGAGSRM